MFWSGNYIVVREVNFLLKDENVTLTQLLEADDILQECKADNKALVSFLTRPEIIAELITLITEEPSQNVELQSQYRHASVASEILTSRMSQMSDRLSGDIVQMHRLCDFINREPPLNPLLASFFSKTVEMLLARGPKQDWYSYHIVCLRVLDFFKSRTDFLPNLFRHIGTSAIMDTFKYFIMLDLYSKNIMEWLEAYQFLETLIQILCGTHIYEELGPCVVQKPEYSEPTAMPESSTTSENITEINGSPEEKLPEIEKQSDTVPSDVENSAVNVDNPPDIPDKFKAKLPDYAIEVKASRIRAGQSANAASLLCDIVLTGCSGEGSFARPRSGLLLMSTCKSEAIVNTLLQSMFTSPAEFRRHAIVNGVQVLLALLQEDPVSEEKPAVARNAVELAIAPHLPLLHQALLQEPEPYEYAPQVCKDGRSGVVGMARLQVAKLMSQLALSEVQEVATTLITLGTPATLLDLFFKSPEQNFLHAQVYNLIEAALSNTPYVTQYTRHLFIECDILTKLMDVFEDNESNKEATATVENTSARKGYMGHVILILRRLQKLVEENGNESNFLEEMRLRSEVIERWNTFCEEKLKSVSNAHDSPLGGYYPTESNYDEQFLEEMEKAGDQFGNFLAKQPIWYSLTASERQPNDNATDGVMEFNDMAGAAEAEDYQDDDNDEVIDPNYTEAQFLGTDKEFFDKSWQEGDEKYDIFKDLPTPSKPDPAEILNAASPWDTPVPETSSSSEEGWAQFNSDFDKEGEFGKTPQSFDDNASHADDFAWCWNFSGGQRQPESEEPTNIQSGLEQTFQGLNINTNIANPTSEELANQVSHLLTAINSISPEDLANLVNANLANDNNVIIPQDIVSLANHGVPGNEERVADLKESGDSSKVTEKSSEISATEVQADESSSTEQDEESDNIDQLIKEAESEEEAAKIEAEQAELAAEAVEKVLELVVKISEAAEKVAVGAEKLAQDVEKVVEVAGTDDEETQKLPETSTDVTQTDLAQIDQTLEQTQTVEKDSQKPESSPKHADDTQKQLEVTQKEAGVTQKDVEVTQKEESSIVESESVHSSER